MVPGSEEDNEDGDTNDPNASDFEGPVFRILPRVFDANDGVDWVGHDCGPRFKKKL